MLQFLHPLWFWAVAGIAIPIAIHLWNTSSGRVLKIGSVAFIPDSVRKSSRRIRMAEWLLLFLRCLIIILIAFFLAEPIWKQEKNFVKEKGWILASPKLQPEIISTAKNLIDSLESVGYVFKKWDTGFATINKTEWLEKSSPDQAEAALKPWDIIRALDHKTNAELPVYIFSKRKLSDYKGIKPATSRIIHWLFFDQEQKAGFEIEQASISETDSVSVSVSEQVAGNSVIKIKYVPLLNPGENFKIKRKTEGLFISQNEGREVVIDTSKIKIRIYSDAGKHDADYLLSALQAISASTGAYFNIEKIDRADKIEPRADWLFWLSSKEIPSSIDAINIFRYSSGDQVNISSTIVNKTYPLAGSNARLFQHTVPGKEFDSEPEVLWIDGFGNPLLCRNNYTKPVSLKFYSRFDPAATDLVWNENFPAWIYNIMQLNDRKPVSDRLLIDSAQVIPSVVLEDRKQINAGMTEQFANQWVWWLLFLVFFIERFLSLRTKGLGK